MKIVYLYLVFSFATQAKEVNFLEKKEYDYCPISQVCGLVIEHYLTDQTTRTLFMGQLDLVRAEKNQISKGQRLDGNFLLASNYSFRSSGNVITFYDGVGVTSSERESELINTYVRAVKRTTIEKAEQSIKMLGDF